MIVTQSAFSKINNSLSPFIICNYLCFSCFEANLNGEYYTAREPREAFRGLIWEHWLGDVSLKKTEMKIRSRDITRTQDPDFDDRRAETQLDDVRPLAIPEDP
jgi:Fibrinogen beta and gamma chains, C-terminal globular domain.